MTKVLLVLTSLALIVSLFALATPQTTAKAAGDKKPDSVLRHAVLFKFKDGTKPDEIQKIVDAFGALPKKMNDLIVDFEWGTDVSVEKKSEGFTHLFLVTFATEKSRDAYLPHAAHKEFVTIVGPHVDKVLVLDYWTKK